MGKLPISSLKSIFQTAYIRAYNEGLYQGLKQSLKMNKSEIELELKEYEDEIPVTLDWQTNKFIKRLEYLSKIK